MGELTHGIVTVVAGVEHACCWVAGLVDWVVGAAFALNVGNQLLLEPTRRIVAQGLAEVVGLCAHGFTV